MPYLSASVVVIHYKEMLYQAHAHLSLTFPSTEQIPALQQRTNNDNDDDDDDDKFYRS